jgi:T-complex protein 1 subunit eta
VVLLATEYLKLAKPFVEDGVHPQIIVAAYRKAAKLALEKLEELAVKIPQNDAK